MTNFLRNFLAASAALVASVSFAQTTVTFDASADKGANAPNAGEDQLTKSGVTISVSNGVLGTDNGQYRTYKGETLTVSSTVGNITKLEITCTAEGDAKYGPGNFVASVGNYTFKSFNGTWTGDAASVALTAETNQVRATKIVVTVGGEAGGNVTDPTTPDQPAQGTIFSESFKDGQGKFTIDDVALGDGLTYVWKHDASRGYMKASAYNKQNIAAESWLVSPEIAIPAGTATLTFDQCINKYFGNLSEEATFWVKANGAWEQIAITYPELTEGKNWSAFETQTIDLSKYAGQTIQLGFKYVSTADAAGTWEIQNVEIKGEVGEVTTPEAANIAAFKALDTKTTAILTLKDAVVQYVGMNDIYVADATGGIDFYKSGLELKAGDVLNGTIEAQFDIYKGIPELVNVTNDDFEVTAGTVTPVELTAAEAAAEENLCKLVTVKDVTLVEIEEGNYTNYYTDEAKTLQVYDKFKLGYTPNTETAMDYTGIIIPYKDAYELCPTEAPTVADGINAVEADAAQNAPLYNLAGQRVGQNYKGVVVMNGKKFIKK